MDAFGMPVDAKGRPEWGPVIEGPLATWRQANPAALVANIRGRRNLSDADFGYLAGIRALNMSNCWTEDLTDASFFHLAGIRALDMSNCWIEDLTDAAFFHLRGIHHLDMCECSPMSITDATAAYLFGVQVLYDGITDCCSTGKITSDLADISQVLQRHPVQSFSSLGDGKILALLKHCTMLERSALLRQRMAPMLLQCLDITLSAPASSEALQFWHAVVENGEAWATEIEQALARTPTPIPLLAYAKSADGRTAYELSKSLCRTIFNQHLFLLGRYELLPSDPREHSSPTCRVLFAHDRSPTRAPTEPPLVALKLMRHEAQYQREVGVRAEHGFSPECVVGIVRTHELQQGSAQLRALDEGSRNFTYLVVLPAADKVCSTVIDSESARSDWAETTRAITRSLAAALAHMHNKGVVHGDVKPRNIVRVEGAYQLIDLDAAVRAGEAVSEKASTAFAAPELLTHLRRPAAAAPLAARPSQDMWALGATLFLMLQRAHLFAPTTTDALDRAEEDGALLAAWPPEAHAAAVLRLRTEDRAARALVFDLLQRDPALRPSAAQVLQHPYLTRQPATARLGGEAPAYDVFVSYRVATEGRAGSGLVQALHGALVAQGLRVFVDYVELADGKNWKEGFCAGAASSRIFLPLLSAAALARWSDLTADSFAAGSSDVDNVLLEHRLAVELRHRGYLSHVFPVFADACRLGSLPGVPIPALERALEEQLLRAGLSLPFTPPLSVEGILRETGRESQGAFLAAGEWAPQLQAIAQRVHALCRPAAAAAAPVVAASATAQQSPQAGGASSRSELEQLQAQLAALEAEEAQREAAHAELLAQREAAHAAALAAALQGRLS